MNINKYNIGVSRAAPIYFSHMVDFPQPSHHRLHLHDYIELFFYVSGDADFILNDTYLHLHPGDVIVAPENVLHKPIIKSETRYERFYIGLPRACFTQMDRVGSPLAFALQGQSVIRPDAQGRATLLRYLNTMDEIIARDGEHGTVRVYAELLRLLYFLGNGARASAAETALPEEGTLPSLIARALPYLDRHIGSINSVEELSHTLGVTPSYLSDLFSRSMKVPLKQYITAKKIALAKARLQEGESVTDTAFACGFCTVSHFIVVFKRVTGVTPSEYRRRFDAPLS